MMQLPRALFLVTPLVNVPPKGPTNKSESLLTSGREHFFYKDIDGINPVSPLSLDKETSSFHGNKIINSDPLEAIIALLVSSYLDNIQCFLTLVDLSLFLQEYTYSPHRSDRLGYQ